MDNDPIPQFVPILAGDGDKVLFNLAVENGDISTAMTIEDLGVEYNLPNRITDQICMMVDAVELIEKGLTDHLDITHLDGRTQTISLNQGGLAQVLLENPTLRDIVIDILVTNNANINNLESVLELINNQGLDSTIGLTQSGQDFFNTARMLLETFKEAQNKLLIEVQKFINGLGYPAKKEG